MLIFAKTLEKDFQNDDYNQRPKSNMVETLKDEQNFWLDFSKSRDSHQLFERTR